MSKLESMTGLNLSKHLDDSNVDLSPIEKVWKDKENPLTSNIISNSVNGKSVKGAIPSRGPQGHGTVGNLVGAAALGALEPSAGAINAFKSVMLDKRIKNVPVIGNVVRTVDKKLVTEPVKESLAQGYAGKAKNNAVIKAKEILMNPVAAQAERTANHLGLASRQTLQMSAGKNAPDALVAKSREAKTAFDKLPDTDKARIKTFTRQRLKYPKINGANNGRPNP